MCAHPPTHYRSNTEAHTLTFITPMYPFILPDPFITIIYMEYFTQPILYVSAPLVDHLHTMRQVWVIALHLHSHHPLAVSVSQLSELYE